MSIRAIAWVLYEAEIKDHGDFRLLTALADRASDDGAGSHPSVRELAKRMRRSERSVQRGLRKLETDGWIRLGDQQLVAHYPADRRPTVYDIVMTAGRGDNNVTPSTPNGVTSDVTPQSPSGVTHNVTPSPPSGVTQDVTPLGQRGDIQGPNGVTSDVTQTVLKPKEEKIGAPSASHAPAAESSRKRPAHRLPADWQPTPAHIQVCNRRGLDLAREAHNFRLHAEEKDRRAVVWNAAFSRWLENARPRPVVTTGVAESGRLWQD